MSKFTIFLFPMVMWILALQVVAQNSGGGSSSGGSSSGGTWPAMFPYPSDFPEWPNVNVTTNAAVGDAAGAFKASYINGYEWIEYTFQEFSPTPGEVWRLKRRDKREWNFAQGTWWHQEQTGFCDLLKDVCPPSDTQRGWFLFFIGTHGVQFHFAHIKSLHIR